MKTLLICIDFSDVSLHAARWGCMLAKQFGFKSITLLHSYEPLALPVAMPVMPPYHDEERYEDAMGQLAELRHELEYMLNLQIPINIKTEEMSLDQNINRICSRENAEMIVTGSGNEPGNGLSENDIMDVVRSSCYPVCVVPRRARIQPVQSILFACDLAEFSETTPLDSLEKILDMLRVPLFVVNVNDRESNFSQQTPKEVRQLHHVFDRYEAKYAFIDRENIAAGLLNFADTYNISLVITITKNYGFFKRLFNTSTTEKLIRRSELPILSVHE